MKPRAVFQFLSLSLVSTQLPPFFFEQQFLFLFFFYRGTNHPFHAGTCKPAGFARTISLYFENEVVQMIVFIVASAPTESNMLTAARGSGGGKGCKCFHNMRAAGVSHMRQRAGINWPPCKHPGGL